MLRHSMIKSSSQQKLLCFLLCVLYLFPVPAYSKVCSQEELSRFSGRTFTESDISNKIQVGNGAFGIVFSATILGCTVAIKCGNTAKSEGNLLKSWNHKNILPFYGFVENCFITKYYKDGDLSEPTPFNASDVKLFVTVVKQIVEGVEYLYNRGILLADLKPSNILYDKESQSIALCDFDAAMDKGKRPNIVTIAYSSPELIYAYKFGGTFGIESTVFVIGQIMRSFLINSEPPSHWNEYDQRFELIVDGAAPSWDSLPPPFNTLIRDCTRIFDMQRPRLDQVLARLEYILETGNDFLKPKFVYDAETVETAVKILNDKYLKQEKKNPSLVLFETNYKEILIDIEDVEVGNSAQMTHSGPVDSCSTVDGFYKGTIGKFKVLVYPVHETENVSEIIEIINGGCPIIKDMEMKIAKFIKKYPGKSWDNIRGYYKTLPGRLLAVSTVRRQGKTGNLKPVLIISSEEYVHPVKDVASSNLMSIPSVSAASSLVANSASSVVANSASSVVTNPASSVVANSASSVVANSPSPISLSDSSTVSSFSPNPTLPIVPESSSVTTTLIPSSNSPLTKTILGSETPSGQSQPTNSSCSLVQNISVVASILSMFLIIFI